LNRGSFCALFLFFVGFGDLKVLFEYFVELVVGIDGSVVVVAFGILLDLHDDQLILANVFHFLQRRKSDVYIALVLQGHQVFKADLVAFVVHEFNDVFGFHVHVHVLAHIPNLA